MRRHKFSFALGILLLSNFAFAQTPAAIKKYIETYKDAAIEDMKESGVPAAITLAQGIHETEAGCSDLVLMSNNHFGIKCKSNWTGETVSHDDDSKGECFRKYNCAQDSYKDHSDFLHASSRYAFLFQLDPMDYESWAYGLKKAGYATNPKYPQILIRLIKEYSLDDYTLIALGRKLPETGNNEMLASVNVAPQPADAQETISGPAIAMREPSYPSGVFIINETKVVFVPNGTSFLSLAEQYNVSLPKLFEFNDMPPQDVTTTDELVYLQRKRKSGNNELHKVLAGENIYTIAQTEALRLESLLQYNYLKEGMQPQVNEVLYLRTQAPAMPKLAQATTPETAMPTDALASADVSAIQQVLPVSDDAYVWHKVQPKETMYSITHKYAVTQDDILKWNALQTPDLKIGQELKISKKTFNGTN